jgi:N-methylhydantoinase A/oxoprolinase/acetone carboxylase beta subunit
VSIRIGIDVGGTSTDAVAVDPDDRIIATAKAATSEEPFDGIVQALQRVIAQIDPAEVSSAMLGTTHLVNALVQRRGLARVGVLRLSWPSSRQPRPGTGWPPDLAGKIIGPWRVVGGGYQYDGSPIVPLDEAGIRSFARECAGRVDTLAISGVFSPSNADQEDRAAEIIGEELGVPVSLSHVVGTLGLIPRENAAILNASIASVAGQVITGFHAALRDSGVAGEAFLTQNDGTLMPAAAATQFPLLTVNASIANSMRGASKLADLQDALVIDVGGTTADMGTLVDGFPRQRAAFTEICGVYTSLPAPEVNSVGFGGGTVVHPTGRVGPDSTGYRVTEEALIGGGTQTTLSDISARAGRDVGFGDVSLAASVPDSTVASVLTWVDEQIAGMVERAKVPRNALSLIAIGGGAHLVPDSVPGVLEVIRPEHYAMANAYGAAIAQVSGSVDRLFHYDRFGREKCLETAREAALDAAVRAGAVRSQTEVVFIKEIPLTYVTGQTCRVQVKATGPLRR